MMYQNRRQINRVFYNRPIEISFGSQVVIHGTIRDVSEKSAFISIRDSVYLQQNDKLNFQFNLKGNDAEIGISGEARISRIQPGEGLAIYFTNLDDESSALLNQMVANK